jgi:transcriptional regulator with XRE-family HTH domain
LVFNVEGAMAEVVSPTVARRRVRFALREARESMGKTQLEVAEEMEWSLSKVIRIENGDVSISPNDLRPLLAYLGVKDRARVSALISDAKIARTRAHVSWWQEPRFRDLSDALKRYFEYESVATAIRSYSIRYIPGPLQLSEYASALTGSLDDELDEGLINQIVDARRVRRESFISRLGKPLAYYTVLDEAVFMRSTGGAVSFAKQLSDMLELASNGLIHIRMLPFSLNVPIANNASFDLLSLGDPSGGNEVLYRENGVADELIEEPLATSRHLRRFNKLWQVAATEADTIRFIGDRIDLLEHGRQ